MPVTPPALDAFVVVDTEGKDLLREIAVLDHHGHCVYHTWVAEHPDNSAHRLHTLPLRQILSEFADLVGCHPVVCHYAQHDRQVLYLAFQQSQDLVLQNFLLLKI